MRHWFWIFFLAAVPAFGQAPARSGGYAEATACAQTGVILCEDFNDTANFNCDGTNGTWTNPGLAVGPTADCRGRSISLASGYPAQPAGSPAGGSVKRTDVATGSGMITGCLWSDCLRTTGADVLGQDPAGWTYANGLSLTNDLYVRFQLFFSETPAYKWPSFDNKIFFQWPDKYIDKPSANLDAGFYLANFWCPQIAGGTRFSDAITFRVGDNSFAFKNYPGDNTNPADHPPHNEYCTGDGMPSSRPDTSPSMECSTKNGSICTSTPTDDTAYPGRGFRFLRGKWYTFEYRYKLSSPAGTKNGIIEVWVDGTKVYSDSDLATCANLGPPTDPDGGGCVAAAEIVQYFWYNIFQEGTNPPVQGYGLVDNLIISTNPIGVPGGGGTPPTGTITITAPVSGTHVLPGSVVPITWTSTDVTGNVKISAWHDNLETVISSSTPYNNTSFTWTIPAGMTSSSAWHIGIVTLSTPSVSDTSDMFRIGGTKTAYNKQ